jgi:hypothetical protein
LRGKVVHTHATDARQASAGPGSAQEVSLGHVDIDRPQYLGVQEGTDYRGWLTIERANGGNRVADVERALPSCGGSWDRRNKQQVAGTCGARIPPRTFTVLRSRGLEHG